VRILSIPNLALILFKILNLELQIREIPDPDKTAGDPSNSVALGSNLIQLARCRA